MSEDREAEKPRSGLRSCLLFGCLPLLGLTLGLSTYLWFSARASLQELSGTLVAEIDAFEARTSPERPVLLGEPEPGNAADHYWLITYVFGPPKTWRRRIRVDLAPTAYPIEHAKANTVDSGAAAKELARRVRAGDRSPLTGEAARFARLYAPLADQVRAGLRKQRCDWSAPRERGLCSELFNLLETRRFSWLMAHQSLVAEGDEAAERGLEVVVLGRDLARYPSLMAVFLGAQVEEVGSAALEQSLPRLSMEGLRRVIAVLGALEPVDLRRVLEAERLGLLVHLSDKAGAPVSAQARAPGFLQLASGAEEPSGLEGLLDNRVLLEREWRLYQEYHRRYLEALELPYSQREAAMDAIRAEVTSSLSLLGSVALPNVHETAEFLEEGEARRQALRMLAAAHLYRLEKGAFPGSVAALKPYLSGALPPDPFQDRERPLGYVLGQGTVTVSWLGRSISTATPTKEPR